MKPVSRVRRQFLKGLKELCDELYTLGDSHEPSQKWKEKAALTTGYIEAGLLIEIVTNDEIEKVIEDCHFIAFGESKSERRARRASKSDESHQDIDWSIFDSPSTLRQ